MQSEIDFINRNLNLNRFENLSAICWPVLAVKDARKENWRYKLPVSISPRPKVTDAAHITWWHRGLCTAEKLPIHQAHHERLMELFLDGWEFACRAFLLQCLQEIQKPSHMQCAKSSIPCIPGLSACWVGRCPIRCRSAWQRGPPHIESWRLWTIRKFWNPQELANKKAETWSSILRLNLTAEHYKQYLVPSPSS